MNDVKNIQGKENKFAKSYRKERKSQDNVEHDRKVKRYRTSFPEGKSLDLLLGFTLREKSVKAKGEFIQTTVK